MSRAAHRSLGSTILAVIALTVANGAGLAQTPLVTAGKPVLLPSGVVPFVTTGGDMPGVSLTATAYANAIPT